MVKGAWIMISETPLFLTNDDWYYYDEDELCYKLTDNAPAEARASYEQYYEQVEHIEGDTVIQC